jgi:hypothetical protein
VSMITLAACCASLRRSMGLCNVFMTEQCRHSNDTAGSGHST